VGQNIKQGQRQTNIAITNNNPQKMKVRAHSNIKNANAIANAQFNNYLMQ
jgi:hypothetical protein